MCLFQPNSNYRQLSYYVLTVAIVVLSFFLYSSEFYPLLNSDDALNVLMAHYYRLPHDLYCWGQDRGGTLIPLISQLFMRIFHCPALLAVSLSNYLVLILGYIGLSSQIKSNYYKIVLAIIWFLPFQRFIDIVRFPIGVEYSLLGFSLFLIDKLLNGNNLKEPVKHALFISVIVLFTLAVWVSDLAIVSIFLLILVSFLFFYKNNHKISKKALFYLVIGAVSCFSFIKFAKSFATQKTEGYLSLNGVHEIHNALFLIQKSFWEVLTFSTNEIFVSIYAYLAIIFVFSFGLVVIKKKMFRRLVSNPWIVFFMADFLVILTILLLSSWVLANGMGRWYFVATYISLSMAIVLALDGMEMCNTSKILKGGVLLLALIGAISPVYTMKYSNPKTLQPKADVVGEFKQLGEIGIIADFWNSYVTSCPDPEHIKATPHDRSDVRSRELVDMVFEEEKIYVIKDMWMETFPDTLEQFGHVLLKEGDPFRLGGCEVCKYKK